MKTNRFVPFSSAGSFMDHRKRNAGETLPESQPLVKLLQEASVELVNGVDVGEEEGHQTLGHGVFFDHSTTEPLRKTKTNDSFTRSIGELMVQSSSSRGTTKYNLLKYLNFTQLKFKTPPKEQLTR